MLRRTLGGIVATMEGVVVFLQGCVYATCT